MRKFILITLLAGTCVMCKKNETSNSEFQDAQYNEDKAISAESEKEDKVSSPTTNISDSVNIKIKDIENAKNDVQKKIENTSKIVDSISSQISSVQLETKKKDSTNKEDGKIVVNVPAPKIIKETKVIYKDKPNNKNTESYTPSRKIVKSGFIYIDTDNSETVKEIVKEEIKKNNGFIKSEEMSYVESDYSSHYSDSKRKSYTILIKVPIKNFDNLMSELDSNLGNVKNKNIEVLGDQYMDNAICNISITLTDKLEEKKEPKTFGEKSFAAIESGWNVITSIFLFILPLWPLVLAIGIGYYFYKKKSKNSFDKDSKQS